MNTPSEPGPSWSRPVVRLKPKAEARAIRHGFPWVYADELVTDRRTQALAPGALAVLEDGERRALGLVTVNTALARSSPGCSTATRRRRSTQAWFAAPARAPRWPCARACSMRPSTGWSMPRPMACPASSSTASAIWP